LIKFSREKFYVLKLSKKGFEKPSGKTRREDNKKNSEGGEKLEKLLINDIFPLLFFLLDKKFFL
jgi:hypothetical protein